VSLPRSRQNSDDRSTCNVHTVLVTFDTISCSYHLICPVVSSRALSQSRVLPFQGLNYIMVIHSQDHLRIRFALHAMQEGQVCQTNATDLIGYSWKTFDSACQFLHGGLGKFLTLIVVSSDFSGSGKRFELDCREFSSFRILFSVLTVLLASRSASTQALGRFRRTLCLMLAYVHHNNLAHILSASVI